MRPEEPADRGAVLAVHDAAFGPPGGRVRTVESRLVEGLDADGDLVRPLCLVAVRGPTVLGHACVSRGDVGGHPLPALGPLGVLPAHQGRGVGRALVEAVLAAADARGEPGVALLGSPAYYGRFGFVAARSVGVEPPDPAWGEHFQVHPLAAWPRGPRGLQGVYRYAPAFSRLDAPEP